MRTAIDVGGTFTDVVTWDGERLRTGKVTTTPDQSEGVVSGLAAFSEPGASLVHGTTAATNAVLQRAGAKTVLVTDAGFEDLIEIGRQDRPSLYDLAVTRTLPLVPRERRVGMAGRAHPGAPGEVIGLTELVEQVAGLSPEAVAVSLLYAFADGARERAVSTALAARLPGIPVSISSEVVAEFREYERLSTTVLNAYLVPIVASYLRHLASAVTGVAGRPAVMRSSGGLTSLEEAARLPTSIVLSGPAGGVVASTALGAALGLRSVISFDMGGTSTDVCRIEDGRPLVSYERTIDGLPCLMPAVAIHTVGAGGGSIAWVDSGGALRVGPRSAGANPGPACYGWGGIEPTVTDADLIVGRVTAGTRLAGTMALDVSAARQAIGHLESATGLDVKSLALGVIEVVEAHMERAVRRVSVSQGVDPHGSVLVAFGGAGGLHATALARRLDMAGVVVPAHAGVFSALGLLLAPPRADAARSVLLRDGSSLDVHAKRVSAEAAAALEDAGAKATDLAVLVDVRYLGQSHETSVPYRIGAGWDALASAFHEAHLRSSGFARRDDPIEVVTIRAEAIAQPAMQWSELPAHGPAGEAERGTCSILTADGPAEARVMWRPGLAPGDQVVGPAVIEEPEATTFLGVGERARVHETGALEVSW